MLTRATFTHPNPAIGETTRAHLVISLHGEGGTGDRAPIAVVPVVDVSGSMGTDRKLHLVTAALSHLSEHLAAGDRLALVAFDSRTRTPVPLVKADPEGVAAFTTALSQLRPGSLTALADGIRAGLAQASRAPDGSLVRVVVLTDGQANVGEDDADSLTNLVRSRPDHVTVSFLGVGSDCDHDLLGLLADHGGGNYGFIEGAADAPAALGNEVGGLLDAEAHNLSITVTARSRYCTLAADAPLGMVGDRDDDELSTTVAQVLRGTTRHVIVPVDLHGAGRNHARPVTCAHVTVKGRIGEDDIEVDLRPKVKFLPEAGETDDALTEKVELAQVAQSITDAREYASRGDFAGARTVVTSPVLHSATAMSLRSALVDSYSDASSYAAASSTLSSTVAATRGSLSGASATSTNLFNSTIGSLYSDGQRRLAAETTLNTRQAGGQPSPAAAEASDGGAVNFWIPTDEEAAQRRALGCDFTALPFDAAPPLFAGLIRPDAADPASDEGDAAADDGHAAQDVDGSAAGEAGEER